MRLLIRAAFVLSLVLSLGLHWTMLQMVAWTGMLIRYSQDSTLREAIVQTFDGQHPCSLCKAVERGRAEENQKAPKSLKPGGKLDPAEVWTGFELAGFVPDGPVTTGTVLLLTRAEPPPKPPPRQAAASSRLV